MLPLNPALVVHVLESESPECVAQAKLLNSLSRLLAPNRYRLHALFTQAGGALPGLLDASHVATTHLPFGGFRDPRGGSRASHWLRRERPAIVHLHVGGRSLPWLVRGVTGAKVVAHLHASYREDGHPFPLKRSARAAHAVIANSHSMASSIRTSCTVVYPGIANPPQRDSRRSSGPLTVGTVGRLAPLKGYRHLLGAVKHLRDRGLDIRAEIAGIGMSAQHLQELASSLGVEMAVDFLGWRDDIWELHSRWEVFACPSLSEGFGLAALEAMGSGLPVVASAVGGLQELVEHGRSGFLVPPGDEVALADRLGALLQDQPLRMEMGAAGRARAVNRFSEAQMVEQIARVYDRLLAAA